MPDWYATVRGPLLLLQSVIGVAIFAYPLRRRSHFLLRLVAGLLVGMLLCQLAVPLLYGSFHYDSASPVLRVLSMIVIYLIVIALVWLCLDETLWTAVFVASSGYAAQDIAGSFKTVLKVIPAIDRCASHPIGILVVDLFCYGGVFLLLYIIFRPYTKERDENFDNKLKAVFSFAVLIFCVGMARITQDNVDRGTVSVIAESLYGMVCDGLILVLQFSVMEQAKLTRNVDTMQEIVRQQHLQYAASKESMQIFNEKYHDLKNILQGFQGTISPSQFEQLKQSIDQYDAQEHTGNEVLDVLLTEKRTCCAQQNIQLTCFVAGVEMDFVDELDLYTLFGNALNNAIDAVAALPQEAERFITMTAARDGNMVSIHVENPCKGDIPFENGLPVSQRDRRYHGFGMKSMERTASKYHGQLTAQQQDGMFYLDILLLAPCQPQ